MRDAFLEDLVRQGLVDEACVAALRAEAAPVRPLLGRLALEHGAITGGDVDRVLRLQAQRGGRFGELAVELGVLTGAELERLLLVQELRGAHAAVEALVLAGVLDAQDAWSAWGRFLARRPVSGQAAPSRSARSVPA